MCLRSGLMSLCVRLTALVVAVALIGLPVPADAAPGAGTPMRCHNDDVRVSIAPGLPTTERIFARLCLPAGRTPRAVQLLTHGWSYDHNYWDVPDPDGGTRYSYVSAAVRAGYATLAYDRLGDGQSSHPPSAVVTFDTGVWIAHQVVQALRTARITGPAGRVGFRKVIEVGHSFGSWYTWFEASRYRDVDAVILSAATHRLNVPATGVKAVLDARPAMLDRRFGLRYDPGYLTTSPGRRYHAFSAPAKVDPRIRAYDEATKQTGTAAELAAIPEILATPLDIRVPAFVVLGAVDGLFCGPLATDCSSVQAFLAPERQALGPHIPTVDGYRLPAAGHDLNLMPNAQKWFTAAQTWTTKKVPPN